MEEGSYVLFNNKLYQILYKYEGMYREYGIGKVSIKRGSGLPPLLRSVSGDMLTPITKEVADILLGSMYDE